MVDENVPGTVNADPGRSLLDDLTITDAPPVGTGEKTPTVPKKSLRQRAREAVNGPEKEGESPTPRKRASASKERVAAMKGKDEFVQPLTELYTMLGVVVSPFDPVGPVIISAAPNCAQSLNDLAAENEQVRKALRSLTQASAMGAVIMAHAPIFISLASNHMPGIVKHAPITPEGEPVTNG